MTENYKRHLLSKANAIADLVDKIKLLEEEAKDAVLNPKPPCIVLGYTNDDFIKATLEVVNKAYEDLEIELYGESSINSAAKYLLGKGKKDPTDSAE